ncbi:hypothetical protein [Curtobacterium sp. VKM Ac-2922]|uniref:hypothetical protein n=1 Tax=Curtobacterium sp. VKM Ac-2922 TaxID=2929475 RepID=UPI001FB48AD1|nr:hypothetical protein [Curtobacterium sp. VKM Ac-2922]MCJ1713046.1 hypothetical protein [Curtobacterium sp. VKM Ac-2922]
MTNDAEWLVRVFIDHGDSPVWYRGPLDYDEMHLSPELERDLRAFEARYDEVLDDRHGYAVLPEHRESYEREGERLARALAVELGDQFAVEVLHPERGSGSRRYRAASPATNRRAQAAFLALHDDDRNPRAPR